MREISLAACADEQYFATPLGREEANDGRPRVCISLAAAGDMWGNGIGLQNRRSLFARIGVEEERVRSIRQVHSRRVVITDVSTPPFAPTEEADGLLSVDDKAILSVLVADCYPIFLFDGQTGAFAALHSGWRGTGISCDALSLMHRRYGTRAADVSALIGPGIGSCCYDVAEERAELFAAQFGPEYVEQRDGRWFIDLLRANIGLLEVRGVGSISLIGDCTRCSPHLGSFRRQGPANFTHMVALIGHFG